MLVSTVFKLGNARDASAGHDKYSKNLNLSV
jgi:hypothetical protein